MSTRQSFKPYKKRTRSSVILVQKQSTTPTERGYAILSMPSKPMSLPGAEAHTIRATQTSLLPHGAPNRRREILPPTSLPNLLQALADSMPSEALLRRPLRIPQITHPMRVHGVVCVRARGRQRQRSRPAAMQTRQGRLQRCHQDLVRSGEPILLDRRRLLQRRASIQE